MIEPTPALFYEIVSSIFKENAIFAIRAVNGVKLVESDSKFCQTLCIGKEGIIYVNKGFWRKHIKTPLDAAFVLLHELFHSVLGDTAKLGKDTDPYEAQLLNLSADMRINAAIANYLLADELRYSPCFIRDFYPDKGVVGLLRPGSSYGSKSKYASIYRMLYSPRELSDGEKRRLNKMFASEESIRAALKLLLPKKSKEMKAVGKIIYIGSHGAGEGEEEGDGLHGSDNDSSQEEYTKDKEKEVDEDQEAQDAPPTVECAEEEEEEDGEGEGPGELDDSTKDDIREALMGAVAIGGKDAGSGDLLFRSMMKVIKSSRPTSLDALSAFACSRKLNELKGMFQQERKVSSMVPLAPSVRELVMVASGCIPIRWTNRKLENKPKNENVAIYLDVSGSVGPYLPKLLGVIASLRQNIEVVFCFSNMVSEHTMDELREGVFKTTYGTDFDCIVKHATENDIDKMIIFTDGCAWLSQKSMDLAREKIKDAAIVFFGHRMEDNFFSTEYGKNFDINDLVPKK